jgi:hypothetical protein
MCGPAAPPEPKPAEGAKATGRPAKLDAEAKPRLSAKW